MVVLRKGKEVNRLKAEMEYRESEYSHSLTLKQDSLALYSSYLSAIEPNWNLANGFDTLASTALMPYKGKAWIVYKAMNGGLKFEHQRVVVKGKDFILRNSIDCDSLDMVLKGLVWIKEAE